MDCKIDETDRISELPLFILHRILSYLPRIDATRASLLSKQWSSVWHSFPTIEFRQTTCIKQPRGTPGFAEKFEKSLDFVDKSLQRFTQNNWRVDILDLNMRLIDKNSTPMVDKWIPLALRCGASSISFKVNTNVTSLNNDYYPLPETTFVVESIRFRHLKKLHLDMVYLSENIVRDITRNCPNISDLCLWFFRGLKALELSKLDKLEKLRVGVSLGVREVKSVLIDAPRLEDLAFISYEPKLPCVIQLTSCHALKKVRIIDCAVTDDLFSSCLSRCPLLEYLWIYECHKLRRIRISLQRLKCLELCHCGELEVVQIHAPNLSRFVCKTLRNMPVFLSDNVIPCSMKIKYGHINTNGPVDSFWFLKLRKFLGVSARGLLFSLYFVANEVSFDPEVLRDVTIPPLVKVELLQLRCFENRVQLDWATLMDGLLWSCHPKAISISSDSSFQINCIKVFCEKLLGSEQEQPLCCKTSHFKCWRHSLKSAKIDKFGWIEDDQSFDLNHLLDSISSLEKGQEVRFRLDWDL